MTKPIPLSKITNAFTPAKEITDSENFAGRSAHVRDAYHALLSEGTNLAIVGGRGIGKSSLARQIVNISEGDNSILDKLHIQNDEKLDYLTVYLACSKNIKDIPSLLTALLTTRDCLESWIYEIPQAKKSMGKLAGSAGFMGTGLKAEDITEKLNSSAITSHDVEVIFQNVLRDIVQSGVARNGILIVIDEFDQIPNPTGFASLLKSLATNTPQVKFCIVGVAQDLQNLMNEHESSDRLFAGGVVNLPSMNEAEMLEIINNAETSIEHYITFREDGRAEIVRLANGHPYITHLIGKQALTSGHLNRILEIDQNMVERSLADIATKEADPVLEGRYKTAVASSFNREAVLKCLIDVMQADGESLTTDTYKAAIDHGVDNPSQYVGQLVKEEYGAEIVKVRERYYRCKDSLFATYVKARPWLLSKTKT